MLKPIKNKKFILRPFRMSDAKSVAFHVNDKAIIRNLSNLPYPYSLKDAKDWLKTKAGDYRQKEPAEIVFAIEIDGEAVGSIGLHKIVRGHKAELGYWLGKKYWGGGVMSDAVNKVVDFGFKKLNLRRIYAKVYSFNKGSMRVLEKNGFKFEGIAIKEAKKRNRFIDAHIFAKVK
ncbi:MAG TPA: GNAT family N-acetyltransferase [Candidatus Bathyarchaeia archaeon]|nr:GNAT family N-acetyltransferase [Candidatus Bathyarchaeia archaeon]